MKQRIMICLLLLWMGRSAYGIESADDPRIVVHGTIFEPAAFDPYSVVSVCPLRESWWIAWHVPAEGDTRPAETIKGQLAEPKFDECLAKLVWWNEEARTRVEEFVRSVQANPDPAALDGAKVGAASKAVKRCWTAAGVDAAILEVLETGQRGARVAQVFAACAKLGPIGSAESEGERP